ncbi:flagellar assembly protein FliX [Methylobacterium sp. A54F]
MRIDSRFSAPGAGTVTGTRRPEPGRAFSLTTGNEPATTQGAAAPATLAGLDAVIALQGNDEQPAERRRRHARRGHDLLDGLDRLKAALLSGRVPTRDLQAIAGRLAARDGHSGDPRLDDLIDAIELRAAVELAKLQVGQRA